MNMLEFISKVTETRNAFDTILASLDETQMLQPCMCGDWSVKDVIAHVTWYEREMIGVIRGRALGGSNLWNLPLEQRNAAIFAKNKDRHIRDILNDSRQTHQVLMELLPGLSDEDLLNANRFREMPLDWAPWEVIASNTFEHYPSHTADIQMAFPH